MCNGGKSGERRGVMYIGRGRRPQIGEGVKGLKGLKGLKKRAMIRQGRGE
jgi:hypothetical protein